jgi:hypothetical protein
MLYFILVLSISMVASQIIVPNQLYGQVSFTSTLPYPTTATPESLGQPYGNFINSVGDSYICDTDFNRVLFYPAGSSVPTRVYGQMNSFTTKDSNKGGISADSLSLPYDVCEDSSGRVYISDRNNNRVLSYPPGAFTTADKVYGQGGSFTTNTANKGGLTASSLLGPEGVMVDSADRLYISDTGNHRVMAFTSQILPLSGSKVYGQGDVFTTGIANKGGISANSLHSPRSASIDSIGNLYIADTQNNRALSYSGTSTTANFVYGQDGIFTTSTTYGLTDINDRSILEPSGISIFTYTSTTLFISDLRLNRIMGFTPGNFSAIVVYGQPDFTSGKPNDPQLGSSTFLAPTYISIRNNTDGIVRMLVTDTGNRRGVGYDNNPGQGPTIPSGNQSSVCFHHTSIINGNTYEELLNGTNKKCVVVHEVRSNGIEIHFEQSVKPVSIILTPDHLVWIQNRGFTPSGLVIVGDIAFFGSENTRVVVTKITIRDEIDTYFGLNCLDSTVYVNGIVTSTFGKYHFIPSIWMSVVGKTFGVEKASKWGDNIVNFLVSYNLH